MSNKLYLKAMFILLLIVGLLNLLSCATKSKSVGLGAGIGGGIGATMGAIADPGKNGEYRTRNVIVGSALGSMIGMSAATAIYDDQEKQRQEAFKKGRSSASPSDGAMPSLKSPQVETRWIEGKVSGNRYIEGHFEYIIVEPARWEP